MDETIKVPLYEKAQGALSSTHHCLNFATFAKVVFFDPDRTTGCRSGRIQEYEAEDVFLSTDLYPDENGFFLIPVSATGEGCIGLQWLERRRLKEITVRVANLPAEYPIDRIQVQGWMGESVWQGDWKAFEGQISNDENRVVLTPRWLNDPELTVETQKVRWIFPAGDTRMFATDFTALTDSTCKTIDISLEHMRSTNEYGSLELYNGAIEDESEGVILRRIWNLSERLSLRIIHTEIQELKWDRTVLRFRLPHASFAVSLEDVITYGCVWIPTAQVFLAVKDFPITARQYLESIRKRKTILQKVRETQDQTLTQALAVTRNPIQDNGPMMLSLACDNNKFIVQQNGTIQWRNYIMQSFYGGKEIIDISRSLEGGWLPSPTISGVTDGVEYRQTAFVSPHTTEKTTKSALPWLSHYGVGIIQYRSENTSDETKPVYFTYDFQLQEQQADLDIYFVLEGAVVCQGDNLVAYVEIHPESKLKLTIHGNSIHLNGPLPPKSSDAVTIYLPTWDIPPTDYGVLSFGENSYEPFVRYWSDILDSAMQIETPDLLLTNVIKASQVSCLIAARNDQDGEFVSPWIASVSYGPLESEANSIIRGMDAFGHKEFARKSLEFFINRYTPDGFITPEYTLMGTGWHLWTVGQHLELYEDWRWLERNASELVRVCEWIIRQCEKTKHLNPKGEKFVEYGLVPPGVIADWNAFAYYFCLNGYYYAGIRAIANVLRRIDRPNADEYIRFAEKYRENIRRAYDDTRAITPALPLGNGEWVMGYPSQACCPMRVAECFPGEDNNRTSAYDIELGAHQLIPQGVINADDPDSVGMMEHMEDIAYLSDGWFDYPAERSKGDWFNYGGFSKIQPYYTRNMEIYALQDEVKPFIRSYFNTLASLLNTENLTLWEHFHNAGAWNKTHETGYFLLYSRMMMIMERGEELWLAPFVTSEWLRDGMSISIKNAPSLFGSTSYRIDSHIVQGRIDVHIENHFRRAPSSIVVRLRHPDEKPIRAVYLNNVPIQSFDATLNMITIHDAFEKIHITVAY